ncbi:hypothetical protein [Bradyrhizobium sp. LTSPM299]|uniref:hypothetical protein n=1 Tax=Bradyrhizobium sp. LTSPM299 TaxID=1619233 RepID=UPI000A430EB2|nr:hypothetical protein [Bradyrhizobium sp. LTSPM299]
MSDTIGVFLDNNVWDFLFDHKIDLAVELPRERFRISITREPEFEIDALEARRPALKNFVDEAVARCEIATDVYFGFDDASLPADEQRVDGFGVGRWIGNKERNFLDGQQYRRTLRKRPTKLYAQEADIALAARSFDCVVITCDKSGAFKDAAAEGGEIVFLEQLRPGSHTLRQLVEAAASNV